MSDFFGRVKITLHVVRNKNGDSKEVKEVHMTFVNVEGIDCHSVLSQNSRLY